MISIAVGLIVGLLAFVTGQSALWAVIFGLIGFVVFRCIPFIIATAIGLFGLFAAALVLIVAGAMDLGNYVKRKFKKRK
ncbi:hypothetical protein NCTGTJJY_CDS0285 [Serratia phage 92A1]|nr:hypothetical protein NCTGTJJY_CDS0285 [Serratia phage 92A1]